MNKSVEDRNDGLVEHRHVEQNPIFLVPHRTASKTRSGKDVTATSWKIVPQIERDDELSLFASD